MKLPRRRFTIVRDAGTFDDVIGRTWTRKGAERRIEGQRMWQQGVEKRLSRRTPPGLRPPPPHPWPNVRIVELETP